MDRPQQRRSKSTFSFKSDKSDPSARHRPKIPLRESHEEKRKSHLTATTKANPNAAMEEAQPIAAALEKPTLQSLRSFQHTDSNGNPIAEPDLSNPTRSRWERPLDTIRSFEAAIDNEYRRRSHTQRAESTADVNGYASRRSSYYGGGHEQNRYTQAGYYGSRQAARESWAGDGYGPSAAHPRARYSTNRMQSDPGWNRYNSGPNGVYPTQGYQQSSATINTGGSGGSHSEHYSTDPSSENSSIERAAPPPPKHDLGEQYGFSGFGGGPILEEYGRGPGHSSNSYFPPYSTSSNLPPPVPSKGGPPAPRNGPGMAKTTAPQPPPHGTGRPNTLQRNNTEKRKSWFKRRFSKA